MNVEANRLATFAGWPSHFPIEVVRIARGGFFATGRGQEAECHWCGQRIADWRYGDQVRGVFVCVLNIYIWDEQIIGHKSR